VKCGISGLYAITPDTHDTPGLLARVDAALGGGASVVQYRNKLAGADLRLMQGRALLDLCHTYAVPLVVNDHLDLALAVEADGLHIGSDDGSVADTRRRLGSQRILGVSCYGRLPDALAAQRAGANYVAFGSFFPSTVKPGAMRAPLELLSEAKRTLSVPVVAIGGITLENASQLVAAGADAVAVISALFAAPDVSAAARGFGRFFPGNGR
jgi:thiamine-phosphate pyrophosphorylase